MAGRRRRVALAALHWRTQVLGAAAQLGVCPRRLRGAARFQDGAVHDLSWVACEHCPGCTTAPRRLPPGVRVARRRACPGGRGMERGRRGLPTLRIHYLRHSHASANTPSTILPCKASSCASSPSARAHVEAVHGEGDNEQPQRRHPARNRPSPRWLDVAGRYARFFHEYGHRKPGGANRSHDILRNMFDCTIAWGHRPKAAGNPCTGVFRYRRPPCGRLLEADELARLGAAVRALLSGCRSGEIRRLRWFKVKPDRLHTD